MLCYQAVHTTLGATMNESLSADRAVMNGVTSNVKAKRGKKQWKDLAVDPLAEGFAEHDASYTVGNSPLTWSQIETGQLFCRTKSGKAVHVKIHSGLGICLDTQARLEIKPTIRETMQVWLITSFNTTTASKANF